MKSKLSIFMGLFALVALYAPVELHSMEEQENIITLITSDGQNIPVPQHVIDEFQTIANFIEDAGDEAPMPVPNVDSKTLQTMIALAQQLHELKQVDNALPANEKIFMPRAYQIKANPILKELSNEELVDAMMAANYLDNEMIINAVAAVIADKLSAKILKEKLKDVILLLQGEEQEEGKKLIEQKMNSILQLPFELQNRIAWHLTLRKDGVMQEYSIADYIKEHNQPKISRSPSILFPSGMNLSDKKLTSLFGLQRIHDLHLVSSLALANNNLRSIPVGIFKGLSSLKILQIDKNELTNIQPGAFDGLSSLNLLVLVGNNLINIQPGTFNGLSSLNTLFLNHNELTSIQAGAFNGLTALRELYLNNNNLTNEQKEKIKADIKKVAPNAKIYF